ncbi:MAG: IS21 family transposase [Flavobacteriales bacterium]
MSKLRQVIKLYCQGSSKVHIAQVTGVSRNTVKKYLRVLLTIRSTADEILALSDKQLDALFCPEPLLDPSQRTSDINAFFALNDKQLRRRGMTLKKLFHDYSVKHPDGFKATQFYSRYRSWKHRMTPSMHMEHKAGDKLFVDFAGETIEYVDQDTGEVRRAQIFLGVLGASQLTYIEAVESQKAEDFIGCCENALHYFGGSPEAFVPDNLKSAVVKSDKYEPLLNENFQALGEHYGVSVVPARTYRPKDKAIVENAVKIAYRKIYIELPSGMASSLAELNQRLWTLLEIHNNGPYKGSKYSRRELFNDLERDTLQPLPALRYEMRRSVVVTVMKNGHVCLSVDKHHYSVPFGHIGRKVKLIYSRNTVEVYFKYELIASHVRVRSPHNYTTDAAHMATHHKVMAEWSPDYFVKRAREIAPEVELYISEVLLKKQHPEQAYRSCNGILSFARRVGHKRLADACRRGHECGLYNFKAIENILHRGLDKIEAEETESTMPAHDNIRGFNYYK